MKKEIKNTDLGKLILERYRENKSTYTRTEVRNLNWASKDCECEIFGKFDNQQITGSFKFRGAYNRIARRSDTRPVIAASAGNHGLAVAEVAKQLGVEATICIPTTASVLKKERLAAYGHSIVEVGSSLDESISYAKEMAQKFDWDFVSPYNDIDLIIGQGSIAVELLEQLAHKPTILLVPVGGGGLLSGVAHACALLSPKTKVIGVCPEAHKSFYESFASGRAKKVSGYPTLADGLAVNVEEGDVTLDIPKKYIHNLVTVSEEELAVASLALMYHESQLVEPSGAAGLAAYMSGKVECKKDDTVAVLFTGGNVKTSTIHNILTYPIHNQKLLRFVNTVAESAASVQPLQGLDFDKNFSDISEKTEENTFSFWRGCLEHVTNLYKKLFKYKKEYIEYVHVRKILEDAAGIERLNSILETLSSGIKDWDSYLKEHEKSTRIDAEFVRNNMYKYRALLQDLLSGFMYLEWRSASYDQSQDTMFFKIDSQGNSGVNYSRYESSQLAYVEKKLGELFSLNQKKLTALGTSSGMAAYTLLEAYLLRYVLKKDSIVYIPHYIYFETDEQISKIPHISLLRTETHDASVIAEHVLKHSVSVLFLDPLTNTQNLEMTDIETVLTNLQGKLQHDLHVVIDGTMMSGLINISKLSAVDEKIKILYYDSCSKYLQLGLDIFMAGLVIVPMELQVIFDRLRRNTGTIMYDHTANIFPIYGRETHLARMRRFSENAKYIGEFIQNQKDIHESVDVYFPLLNSHKDIHIAEKFDAVGGVITFMFKDPSLNHRDSLNSFIDILLNIAHTDNVSITKGVSFGFVIPRISAAAAMAENAPPFLRLSVGEYPKKDTHKLAEVLAKSFKTYLEKVKKL